MKIFRNADVITGLEDLEPLHTFPQFPVFMGCTSAGQDTDILADMCFQISPGSGMIQLNPLLPLEVLYPEAHGAGAVGKLWEKHHQALSDFIAQFDPASVLEIGGGHGILATNYQNNKSIPWTILEPNPTPIPACKARIIKGFFDGSFKFDENVEAIVHSHVFEHIYDPDAFVTQLADFLVEGKKLFFSIPNMQVMMKRKYTNCLNFEHTVFLSEPYVDYLLARHGFRILEKEYFQEDHSIFYAAVRDRHVPPVQLEETLYAIHKQLFTSYVAYHQELVTDINRQLASNPEGAFLFGAHVFAQYLIAFGLDTRRIVSILDNDPNKQGKRLYGTDLMVQSPKILKNLASPKVVLKAGVYNEEIKADILSLINETVIFIE